MTFIDSRRAHGSIRPRAAGVWPVVQRRVGSLSGGSERRPSP
jgi:hypothetical protein